MDSKSFTRPASLGLVLVACGSLLRADAAALEFHTSPACWAEARTFHTGPPPAELANRVRIIRTPAGESPTGEAEPSPGGAYRLWVRNPDTSQPGPWAAALVIDSDRAPRTTLLIEEVAGHVHPRWLNERLVFLRITWGRVAFTDLILDAESGTLRYHEQAHDGATAYAQFQEACGGSCPCPGTPAARQPATGRFSVGAPIPQATPGVGAHIGLLELPTVFGRPEQGGVVPAENPDPVPVYLEAADAAEPFAALVEPGDFEHREYTYEGAAAVVYRKRPGWFEIGVRTRGRAWIRASDAGAFMPIGELLVGRSSYLNEHWDGHLWSDAGAGLRTAEVSRLKSEHPAGQREEHPVRVLEARSVGDGLWLRVETTAEGPCTLDAAPAVDQGWVPAYALNGRLVAGYHSRGC